MPISSAVSNEYKQLDSSYARKRECSMHNCTVRIVYHFSDFRIGKYLCVIIHRFLSYSFEHQKCRDLLVCIPSNSAFILLMWNPFPKRLDNDHYLVCLDGCRRFLA